MNLISRLLLSGIKCLGGKNVNSDSLYQLKFYQQCQNLSVLRKPDMFLSNSKVFTHCRCLGTTFKIKHDEYRFFIETKEGVAQLKYAINDGVMDIKHTGVPRALGGHGIGKLLAKVFVCKDQYLLRCPVASQRQECTF